jgi:hypothetical protein
VDVDGIRARRSTSKPITPLAGTGVTAIAPEGTNPVRSVFAVVELLASERVAEELLKAGIVDREATLAAGLLT